MFLFPRSFFRFFFNLLIFIALITLLAACASSGPSAEAVACRGTPFAINATSTPASTPVSLQAAQAGVE
jgi:hypothetical protein